MGKKSKGKDKATRKARRQALLEARAAAEAGLVADHQVGPDVDARPWPEPPRETVAATELAAHLASLSMLLQRHISRTDPGSGLTRARLSALALLVLGGPRTLGQLAAAEHVRPPTMTRLVQAMEADGLVEREPNPADRRSIVIRATPAGVGQLDLGRARQIAPLAATIAGLSRAERLRLEEAADLLGQVLREAPWDPLDQSR
jgi:DNA-binding MarR family transcriptional regulator